MGKSEWEQVKGNGKGLDTNGNVNGLPFLALMGQAVCEDLTFW